MGYFDYLEEKMSLEKDQHFFDTYAKVSFWVGVGTFGALILSIIILCLVPVGSVVWLDIMLVLGLASGVVSNVYAIKTKKLAKSKEQSSPLANFSFVWVLLFNLIFAIMIVMNTWIYFA